ncbi:hypothetical protein [Streptomyces sp. NPDC051636]
MFGHGGGDDIAALLAVAAAVCLVILQMGGMVLHLSRGEVG